MQVPSFDPPFGLRAPFTQSLLATKRPARWLWRRRGIDLSSAPQTVLDCGDGVRLSGYHSPQPAAARGLVVLIHGWEGHHESNYLYSMACALFGAGYSVFRLNLRDHGGTHHLNEALFHSARMGEVLGAFHAIRKLDPGEPLFVIGFSLGGNFALRVGLHGPATGIRPRMVAAVSPAINPGATLRAIDEGPSLVHGYFISKWMRTLEAKQEAWPARYDFRSYRQLSNFVAITERFVADFTEYESMDQYLAEYTLNPRMLMDSPTPLAIITSQDDSVIPFRYFDGLAARGAVRSFLPAERGGHCGFIDSWSLRSWAEARVLELFAEA
jgi:predicted alpha/beta-fold hydrolase